MDPNEIHYAGILLDALESMEEAFVAYDADGCLIVCNKAFREMYNYTQEQARPGVHFQELGEIDARQGNVIIGDDIGVDYLERKNPTERRLPDFSRCSSRLAAGSEPTTAAWQMAVSSQSKSTSPK